LSGLTVNDPVFVTAYDNLADGTNDLVEGHESWYSEDIIPNASITSTDTVVICQGNNTVLFANNYPNTQYQWQKNGVNTGVNADSLNVTQAGNYRVIETNINGCKDTSNVVVVNVNSLSIENFTSTIVCGQLIPLNNTINYIGNNTINYSWISDPTLDNISIAHPNANPINTTTYTVNATDGVCQATATATITVNPLTVDAGYDQTIICGGSAQLDNVSTNYTGTGTLTYSWSPNIGLNNTSIANPTATITSDQTYFVTVTTDNGCIATDDITVTVNPLPTVTASANPAVICNGGTSELTASGTDNYSWNTGGTGSSITVTPSTGTNTYTVTGTTSEGCTGTATVSVTVNPIPVAIATNVGPFCEGDTLYLISYTDEENGSFKWEGPMGFTSTSQNPTLANATPLMNGIYTVTLTNEFGCTNSSSTMVSVNPLPILHATANPQTICRGQSTTLQATGANNYAWSNGLGVNQFAIASPTITTTYTVTGTRYSCPGSTSITVVVNPTPTVSAYNTGPYCTGDTIQLNLTTNGTTYSWSGHNNYTSTTEDPIILNATPMMTGTYSVTVTSVEGCTSSASTNVVVDSIPQLNIAAWPPTICEGESSTLIVSGANTYVWSNGLGNGSSVSVMPIDTSTYIVTGYSSISCSATTSITVNVNEIPNISILSQPSSICEGDTSILTAYSNATEYIWSHNLGSNNTISILPNTTTTYSVTGNYNGCTGSASITVTVKPKPTAIVNNTGPYCTQDTIMFNLTTNATSYSWSGPNGFVSVLQNPKRPNADTLMSGTYLVTVTNSEGCSNTASTSVIVNPTPIIITNAFPDTLCFGENSVISASGTYIYSWSHNLGSGASKTVTPTATTTYTVTGTSTEGCTGTATVIVTVNPLPTITATASPPEICLNESSDLMVSSDIIGTSFNWSNGLGTNSSVNVSPTLTTTYSVTGTTLEGCTGTAEVTLTVHPLPTVTATANPDSICLGNSSILTANSNIQGTTYEWNTGGNTDSITVTPSTTNTYTYTVTGTTLEGCTGTATISVTVNPLPTVTASANPSEICLGDSSELTVSSNITGTTFNWSNGLGTNSSVTVSPTFTTTYSVIGTTLEGCTGTAEVTLTVHPLPTMTASANPNSVCLGESSILTASSDIPGTTYSWNTGGNTDSITVTPSTTTTYIVTGTTLFGCSSSTSINVTVNALPNTSIATPNDTICSGQSTILTASGADFYSWSHYLGTDSSQTVSPTSTTTYTVTGSLDNGCLSTATIQITVNPIPYIIINATNNSICFGDSTTLNVIGDAIQYSWSHNLDSGTTITVFPVNNTTYTVTGTNIYGCTNSATIYITVNPNADVTIKPVSPLCDNWSFITLTADTPGGIWSGDGITNEVLGTFSPAIAGAGTHTITYMITGMCVDTATTEITVYESPYLTSYYTNETCIDANDGTAWVEVAGGTSPYTYLWSTYHNIDSVTNLEPGEYYVTVTDIHNCFDKDTILIKPGTEDCYITHIYIPNIFSPDGRGNPENEYLRVYGKGIKTIDFTIFDRWGNVVFHTTDINIGWDGTYKGEPALVGDYTYVIKVSYLNGNNEALKGHIYLIR